MLVAAFACLGSKLFNRYVVYYGVQSIVLSFAAGVVAYHFASAELWALAFHHARHQGRGHSAGDSALAASAARYAARRRAVNRTIEPPRDW